jgi:hypothetical protein
MNHMHFTFSTAAPCQLMQVGQTKTTEMKAASQPLRHTTRRDEELIPEMSYCISLDLGTANMICFSSAVGFHYCVHKQMCLMAVVAVRCAQEFVQAQYVKLCDHVCRLIEASFTIRQAMEQAKTVLCMTEVLHLTLDVWSPTKWKNICDTLKAYQMHNIIEDFDIAKFFSVRCLGKWHLKGGQHIKIGMDAPTNVV